jgi:hypothetical protein
MKVTAGKGGNPALVNEAPRRALSSTASVQMWMG